MPIAALNFVEDDELASISVLGRSVSSTVILQDVGVKGDVGINFRGEYSNTTQYFEGDAVNFNGVVYIVTSAPPIGTDPTDGGIPPVIDLNWGVLIAQPSETIGVAAHGNMPAGSLQEILEYLEDKQFSSATDPTIAHAGETHAGVPSVNEGDLWYDETNDQMNVYRNGEWEPMTLNDALAFDPTDDPTNPDDNIEMDGGTF